MGATERRWQLNMLMNLVIAQSHQPPLILTWVAFVQQTLHQAQQRVSSVGSGNLSIVPCEKAVLVTGS